MVHDFKKFPELTNNQMLTSLFDSPHVQITDDIEVTVVKVIDGDTIRVRWDERDFDFPVRLAGLAAPEKNEKGGEESRKWLANKILGKEVLVEIDPWERVEKWGRLLGRVSFEGIDIATESVLNGHGIPWEDRKEGSIPDFDKQMAAVWNSW